MLARGRGLGGVAILVTSLACLVGCARDDQDPDGAAELFERIDGSYQNWTRPAHWEGRRESGPHSDEVDLFVNPVVASAITAAKPIDTWPIGSILVLDEWDDDKPSAVAAMEKREDGWFWAEWLPGGESLYSGKPQLCIECHSAGDDFVRSIVLP